MKFGARSGWILRMAVAAAVVCVATGVAVGQVDITAMFKDANFRAEVYKLIKKTAPAPILDSDVSGIEVFYARSLEVTDLSGIEYFTALTELDCVGNQLTALDVSKNTALTKLWCHYNQLTTLDVSKNTALTRLVCDFNQLTTLDVSKNTALTTLSCTDNQLTTLDVSKNIALTTLVCYKNQLTTLDVSKNTALMELTCYSNKLTTLNVSQNFTLLLTLNCFDNQLTTLDVSKNFELRELYCSENQLTALDVSNNRLLMQLGCSNNQLTTLDVSKNTELTKLSCGGNQLTTLDVSKNALLRELVCYDNRLTALDVSNNTALTMLDCGGNQLTTLDVSKNTRLYRLYCGYNQLTTLDLSNNTALKWLTCSGQIRFGYIFGGWYKDTAYTSKWYDNWTWYYDTSAISTNSLYAKWIPIFTITFNANGGTVTPASDTTRADSTLFSLPTPERGVYAFNGWFTAETGGEKVTESRKYSANTNIYAQWTQSVYTVTLDPTGGTVTPLTVRIGESGRIVSLPNPERAGYHFDDWFTATSSGERVTEGYTINKDVTIYARWIPIYTITFDAVGGTVTPETATTDPDRKLVSLPTPTKVGYTFNEWLTAATDGEKVTESMVFTTNSTIYAKWTYNAVTDITDVPNALKIGEQFPLTGTVVPENAARNTIVWSVENAGTTNAGIYDGVFYAMSEGPVVLKATIADGKDVGVPYEQFFFINAVVSVASPARVIPPARPAEITSISPVTPLTAEFAVGPNPVSKSSGKVSFFRNGSRVSYATLSIYDASGNVIRKIRVIDDAVGSQTRRKVSSWDLRDSKGRLVSEGTYVVRGAVKTNGGKREKVSVVVGVR